MPQYILDMLDEKGMARALAGSIEEVIADVDILLYDSAYRKSVSTRRSNQMKAQFVLRASLGPEPARVKYEKRNLPPRIDEITTDVG